MVYRMELKIPPPLLALMFAVLMWGISKIDSLASVESEVTIPLSLVVLIVGLVINISAVVSFRAANTTVNPMKPRSATQLVNTGVYRLSRNPMYLGALLILSSWTIWLGNPVNLAALVFFIWTITRFQIVPEERALKELFPSEFELYQAKVRRWI